MLGCPLMIFDAALESAFSSQICEGLNSALVVGTRALRHKCRRTVTLEVGNGANWRINRQLLVVDTKTMAVGVRIRKETRLQDGINRILEVGNNMRRRKCGLEIGNEQEQLYRSISNTYLLDLGKVVLRILIENKLADGAKREFGVRPNLSQIEDVVFELLRLLRCHGLLRRDMRWEICGG